MWSLAVPKLFELFTANALFKKHQTDIWTNNKRHFCLLPRTPLYYFIKQHLEGGNRPKWH